MDTLASKHPDEILNRYFLLVEREAAYARCKELVWYKGDDQQKRFVSCNATKIAKELAEAEAQAIAYERVKIIVDAAAVLGIKLSNDDAKGLTERDRASLLALYEWLAISKKESSEAVWGGPTPWRDAAMLISDKK